MVLPIYLRDRNTINGWFVCVEQSFLFWKLWCINFVRFGRFQNRVLSGCSRLRYLWYDKHLRTLLAVFLDHLYFLVHHLIITFISVIHSLIKKIKQNSHFIFIYFNYHIHNLQRDLPININKISYLKLIPFLKAIDFISLYLHLIPHLQIFDFYIHYFHQYSWNDILL